MAFGPRCFYPLISRLIGEALADDGGHQIVEPDGVGDAERDSVIVAEIELRKIAVSDLLSKEGS